jgi:hypothetical protein
LKIKQQEVEKMGAILEGILALIWATIAVIAVVFSFLGGNIVAAIVFLVVVFLTPYVLNFLADIV